MFCPCALNLSYRLSALLVCSVVQFGLWAQADTASYDFSKFRFPDINRRALDLGGSLNGAYFDDSNRPDRTSAERNSGRQDFSAIYSHFINRDKLQALRSMSLNQGFTVDKEQLIRPASTVFSRNTSLKTEFSASAQNRYYYRPDRYYGADWLLNASYNYFEQKATNILTSGIAAYGYALSIPLRIGKGRIEPIDDVFLAKFMTDDMRANGVLQAPISQEDLFALGRVMAHARNQRIFDFRRQRLYELERLHEWFGAAGLTDTDNFLYFSTLTDNWIYGFNNVRFAGKRLSVGLEPVYNYSASSRNTPFIRYSLGLIAGYEYEKPLNQYWQLGYAAFMRLGYQGSNVEFPIVLLENYFARGSGQLSLGYYPNSRTRLNLTAGIEPTYRVNAQPILPVEASHTLFLVFSNIQLRADYFLNFRTRLLFDFNLRHSWSDAPFLPPQVNDALGINNSTLNVFGGVRLLYSLF